MVVSCKMVQCPYHDEYNFCARPTVVSIDQNGMCNVIWRKGQSRMQTISFTNQIYKKNPIIVEEYINDVTKEESKEDAGSRLEDPINGTAAHNGDS